MRASACECTCVCVCVRARARVSNSVRKVHKRETRDQIRESFFPLRSEGASSMFSSSSSSNRGDVPLKRKSCESSKAPFSRNPSCSFRVDVHS